MDGSYRLTRLALGGPYDESDDHSQYDDANYKQDKFLPTGFVLQKNSMVNVAHQVPPETHASET